MDEVIADALYGYLERYREEVQIELPRADLIGKKVCDVVREEHRATVRDYPVAKTFFATCRLLRAAKKFWKNLVITMRFSLQPLRWKF